MMGQSFENVYVSGSVPDVQTCTTVPLVASCTPVAVGCRRLLTAAADGCLTAADGCCWLLLLTGA